jgi:predicted Rossmann fold flavoprotein
MIARSYILATGGMSHPETGSTGDGFNFLKDLGHSVIQPTPDIVPISVYEDWVKSLAGVSLSFMKINFYQNGKKQFSKLGKILFTHFGLSGPLILNQSKAIGDLLYEGEVTIKIDLAPEIDSSVMQAELLTTFTDTPNKKVKNVLATIIKTALVEPVLMLLQIDGDTPVHSIKSADRKRIGNLLKALPLNVTGLLGSDKAVATAGGVDLTEVDFRTMESRLVPGLYLVGDVLNINRPSGGYSLQLCWSTGYVAGRNI